MKNLNNTAHKILDAAETFTQTQGFNGFSYKDIQAAVGIKTSSIHYYFATKQDLAKSMAERYIERFLNSLDKIERKNKKAIAKLEEAGQIFIDVADSGKLCLCGMLTSDILSLSEGGLNELRRFYKESERWIAKSIKQGIKEGDLRELSSAEGAATHLLATLEGGILVSRARKDSGYMQAVLDQALSFLKK